MHFKGILLVLCILPVSVGKLTGAEPSSQPAKKPVTDLGSAKAGDVWVHPVTGKQMVLVPSGYIQADSESRKVFGTLDLLDANKKVIGLLKDFGFSPRFVTGFLMDATEVTNDEYHRYVKATKSPFPKSWEGEDPVLAKADWPARVSLKEAEGYAKWAGLRLPSLYEFCAATATVEGVYPWRNTKIGNKDPDSPVATNEDDVSPLGIRDLAGHATEWGDTQCGGYQLRFDLAFRTDGDKKGALCNWAPFGKSDGVGGFRCVSDVPAVTSVVVGKPVGIDKLPDAPSTVICNVEVKNNLDSDAEVRISNLQKLALKAGGVTTVKLPIGLYVVTVKGTQEKIQLLRFWRCTVAENPTGDSSSYTWTLVPTLGDPVQEPTTTSSARTSLVSDECEITLEGYRWMDSIVIQATRVPNTIEKPKDGFRFLAIYCSVTVKGNRSITPDQQMKLIAGDTQYAAMGTFVGQGPVIQVSNVTKEGCKIMSPMMVVFQIPDKADLTQMQITGPGRSRILMRDLRYMDALSH